MSPEINGVIVGAILGSVCSLVATGALNILTNLRRARSIRAIAAAEVTAIMEKAQRYVDGESSMEEVSASIPMLVSIASEIGYLSEKQVISFRRAVTLDTEMRKQGNKDKARATIEICRASLKDLSKA